MGARITTWVLGILLTLLYASTVIAATGNLVLLPKVGAEMGYDVTAFGWFWLWFGILMPVLVFGLALLIGRKRRAATRLFVLFAGLAVVSVLQLEVLLVVPQSAFFVA